MIIDVERISECKQKPELILPGVAFELGRGDQVGHGPARVALISLFVIVADSPPPPCRAW